MTSKPPSLSSDWGFIAAIIAGEGDVEITDIAAALRSAGPEIDDLIELLHTQDVAYVLQARWFEPDDEALHKLLDALERLLFVHRSIVPAPMQHYIADLIDPPPKPRGRPKRARTPMRVVQLEIRERKKAEKDVADMEDLLRRHGDDRAAMKAFAQARRVTLQAARRRYKKSKRLVEEAEAELQELHKQHAQPAIGRNGQCSDQNG
jgi:hypothetical protein